MSNPPEQIVSIIHSHTKDYPKHAPFHASEIFPEFTNVSWYPHETDIDNDIYRGVRQIFIDLELDAEHIGTPEWNPLRDLVSPWENVVIKPNLVLHKHPMGEIGVLSMVTHASVIRPVVDYVLLATEGKSRVTIADVPLHEAIWDEMTTMNGLQALVAWYETLGYPIELLDLRKEIAIENEESIIIDRIHKDRDPRGYSAVDFGTQSALMPIIEHYKRFEITNYGSGTVPKHHNYDVNEYCVPNTILQADLFINMPKLKTHRKTGMTFALKNLIGINGDKAWLAHHRRGAPEAGGDEYDVFHFKTWLIWHTYATLKKSKLGIKLATLLYRIAKRVLWSGKDHAEVKLEGKKKPASEGSWYGNDTVWRCIKDLNCAIFFANREGELTKERQRRYLCIGDGILAGDKEGPLEQRPRPEGILIGGRNPVYIDRVAASIMGFDYTKMPMVREAFVNEHFPLCPHSEEEILWKGTIENVRDFHLGFTPTANWQGHVELL